MVTLVAQRLATPLVVLRRRSFPEPQPWWLIFVIALGIGVPLLVAGITGNLAIPHNDSWAYSRITSVFWHTGQIHLLNYNDMSLIGLIFMVGPLGTSVVAQQVGVAITGAVAVCCCYAMTARITSTGRALLAASILVVWPGFANLTTSFMTDVPTIAASWLALVIGQRALRDDSRRLLVLSLVVGFWGATIREEALAAPAAIVIVGLYTYRSRMRVTGKYLVGASAIFAVLILAFLHWRDGMPNGQDPHLVFHPAQLPGQVLDVAGSMYFTLGALLAPVALLVARPWRWSWVSWLAVAVVAGLAIRIELTHSAWVIASNGGYLYPGGEYQYVIGGIRNVVPGSLWNLVMPIAIAGGLALAGELAANWRRSDPIVTVFTLLSFVAVVAVAVGYWPLFDRYLIPLVPGVAAPLFAGGRHGVHEARHSRVRALTEQILSRTLPAAGVASFAVIGAISAMLALNAFAFDAARWRTASKVVALGVAADRVDAGLEWDGWHSQGPMTEHAWASKFVGAFDFAQSFYTSPPCVVEAASPFTPGDGVGDQGKATLVTTTRYHTLLVSGESKLYVYATHIPGCPQLTAAGV
jgi:hypothetical protein